MFRLILIALVFSLQYDFIYVHEDVQNYVI